MILASYLSYMAIATMVGACLPQNGTNGKSLLGTGDAPQYGAFLTDNPLPSGYPWGGATARKTNPYMEAPETGVTRYYDFTIDSMIIAPDGVGMFSFMENLTLAGREMLLINGAFPGPTIEAHWGDIIQVTV